MSRLFRAAVHRKIKVNMRFSAIFVEKWILRSIYVTDG